MQQQQQPALNPDEAFAESIYKVSIFGDERDIVIAKWNFLQAMWGHGKAFYAKNLPPVEITPQNVRSFKIHFKIVSTISIGFFFFDLHSSFVVLKRSVTIKFPAKIIKWD